MKVRAGRAKGAQIELLYSHGGDQWLVRFFGLRARGALKGKIVSRWKGSPQVRLRIGRHSIKPARVRQVKRAARPAPLPAAPILNRLRAPRLDTAGGSGCATPDAGMDNFWSRSGPGWTGGDSTYSTQLPDGRVAWLFGDTFLGTVADDGTPPGQHSDGPQLDGAAERRQHEHADGRRPLRVRQHPRRPGLVLAGRDDDRERPAEDLPRPLPRERQRRPVELRLRLHGPRHLHGGAACSSSRWRR